MRGLRPCGARRSAVRASRPKSSCPAHPVLLNLLRGKLDGVTGSYREERVCRRRHRGARS